MNDRQDDSRDGHGDEDVVAEYDAGEDELERNPGSQGSWTSLAIGVLGVWLVVSPWVFELEFGEVVGINSIIVGVMLAFLGGYNFQRRTEERLGNVAVAAFAALLGLWLLVTPWVFELGLEDLAGWNFVVVGLLVAGLGLVSSYEASDQDVESAVAE